MHVYGLLITTEHLSGYRCRSYQSFDELLCNDAFLGFEDEYINTGLGFGSVKWNTVVRVNDERLCW